MISDLSPEELRIFLAETDELLELMEEDLVRLEKDGATEDLLNEIFRAAHTLKGSAGVLDYVPMVHICHAMETLFDRLRHNELEVTSEFIDVLLDGTDVLKEMRSGIGESAEPWNGDISGLLERLATFDGRPAPVEVALEAATVETVSGETTHLVKVTLQSDAALPSVRAFQVISILEKAGKVQASVPTAEEIERDWSGQDIEVQWNAAEDPEAVAAALRNITDVAAVAMVAVAREEESGPPKAGTSEKAASNGEGASRGRTVRVDVEILDNLMNLVGELVIDRTHLNQMVNSLTGNQELEEFEQELGRTSQHIGRVSALLQEEIMKARMLPVDTLFKKFPRMVRDLAQKAGKEVEFVVSGQETELDRLVIEEIGDPLIHLLRNSVDHGLESPDERVLAGKDRVGRISLSARTEEGRIVIEVADDGKGIDSSRIRQSAVAKGLITPEAAEHLDEEESLRLIYLPGLSTAAKVSDISGRGVGMDVVRTNLEKLNGTIDLATQPGNGSRFTIRLPLTLAILRALLVGQGPDVFAVPLTAVAEILKIPQTDVKHLGTHRVTTVRDRVLHLESLGQLFDIPGTRGDSADNIVVVVKTGGQQVGLVVDDLLGEQEVVVKSLGNMLGGLHGLYGATILGDGRVALIIDVGGLWRLRREAV